MAYHNYITRKRAKFNGISTGVNLPYNTKIKCREMDDGTGVLYNGLNLLCYDHSQNCYDYFSQNDDECGLKRGSLVNCITDRLSKDLKDQKDNGKYQKRWDVIWKDELCQKYKRKDHDDHWLWNYEFFHAPIQDLEYIWNLIRKI